MNGSQFASSDTIVIDARNSVDYDEDEFTMTLRSFDDASATYIPILADVSTSTVHEIQLDAGLRDIQIELVDATGKSRVESLELLIVPSDPEAVIVSPTNLDSIDPGAIIVFEGASSDADDDLVTREWRLHVPGLQTSVLSTQSTFTQVFVPGSHHVSLYVQDARGASSEQHINFTVRSSLPELVQTSLELSQTEFVSDERVTLDVSVQLIDADGTTDDVRVDIVHNIQTWTFNLSDDDGDGIWTGSLEFQPSELDNQVSRSLQQMVKAIQRALIFSTRHSRLWRQKVEVSCPLAFLSVQFPLLSSCTPHDASTSQSNRCRNEDHRFVGRLW